MLVYGVMKIIYILVVVDYMPLCLWWLHECASQSFNYREHNWQRALAAESRNPLPHLNQMLHFNGYSQTKTGHSKDFKAGPLWKFLKSVYLRLPKPLPAILSLDFLAFKDTPNFLPSLFHMDQACTVIR